MIKDFEPRLYQQTILGSVIKRNSMVVLPTGMGKTFLFLMLADFRLRNFPNSKILLLAPTKPLCQQHMETADKHMELAYKNLTLLTGAVLPEKRMQLWDKSNLIFSTPQTIENDLVSERISLKDVSLICFDECHRAVGDYAYVWIAKEYQKQARYPHTLALTASPGSEIEKIAEICQNLAIEDIELRTYEDPDVKPYIKEIKMNLIEVELPEKFKKIKKYFEDCFKTKVKIASGLLGPEFKLHSSMSKREILLLQRQLHSSIGPEPDFGILRSISLVAEALKVHHALELLETQGVYALNSYISRLIEASKTTKTKAVRNLVIDKDFRAANHLVEQLIEEKIEHPKFIKMLELIEKEKDSKVIIFNQYRDSAKRLEEEINKGSNSARLFVGQAKKNGTGLTQKGQKEMLDGFRSGEFNVLISTSIGEEGLDIPKVDLVVFYEPVPSAIRSIQRRGRTGRQDHGRVILLVTKGTRDVAYKWTSISKERRMYRILSDIKKKLGTIKPTRAPDQSSLQRFSQEKRVKILIDAREKGSPILKILRELGAKIELKNITSADYVCSKDVGIEFKTRKDFVDSIIDKRLLIQAKRLRENFAKPLLIIQDGEEISRMVNKKAIYGAKASIALGFQIPTIATKNPQESAELIYTIAKREQSEGDTEFSMHFNKPLSLKEQQEYIVSALPGIGPKLAKVMLKKFKNIKGIFNATEEELQSIELIGKKKSQNIKDVLNNHYKE